MSDGIGMAVVKKIAAALSGSIRWRSSVGAGSTYTIKLPVASESPDLPEFSDIKLLAHTILPETMPRFKLGN